MIAIIYLAVVFIFGDLIVRRFFHVVSLPHRVASAFIVGIVFSTWTTYLSALMFTQTSNPMLWGNLLFFALAIGSLIYWKNWLPKADDLRGTFRGLGNEDKWDFAVIAVFALVATWMMFATFNMSDGSVQIANHQWSDFGSTVSIMQTFAEGHNFPTTYPHFSGERIRYHFLYYFQAGNLEYLGLNPAMSNNLLSIFSLVSLLVMVMTLGRILFNSRAVGRIGAALFFFHGSLAFMPFLAANGWEVFSKLSGMIDFLKSGFPYRGEDWGVWSQVVYLNQRHLASSIAVFLMVLIFLATRYKEKLGVSTDASPIEESHDYNTSDWRRWADELAPFLFSGLLLGLLPLWNGAVFAAAGAVLAVLFVVMPLRKEMAALATAALLVALPQIIFLKTGSIRPAGYSLFHWGYTVDDPTLFNVGYYLIFTFGFKLVLVGIALYFASGFQRRFMAAVTALIALAFCFQFSDEVLANHKFLNIWLVIANIFAAFGLLSIWNLKAGQFTVAARAAAIVLAVLVTIGGVIDLFPIRNGYWVEMKYDGDSLVNWVRENTDPKSIFLAHRHVNHRILLAGRRLFYGHPYYAWGAGYDTGGRDEVYKKMFESKDAAEILRLLKENKIDYVAIDNAVRKSDFIKKPNESVYETYFPKVFADTENRYDNLNIYRVPDALGAPQNIIGTNPNLTNPEPEPPAVNALEGGVGEGRGEFSKPRGIVADTKGNFYVADTVNARVQKFDSAGNFVAAFGKPGDGEGEFEEPNGIAVDAAGSMYVTDALRHRLIKFNSDGTFVKEWKGPEINLYGSRDIAIGPTGNLYILDQGRTRVVKFNPTSEAFSEWGSAGAGEGQFNEATGIAIGVDLVFVTDAGNNRIQVFDLDGKFVRQWDVPEWEKYPWHYPDVVFDEQAKRLYVTNGWKHQVLAFDIDGNVLEGFNPEDDKKLDNPSSLFILETDNERRLLILNTGSGKVSSIELEAKRKEPEVKKKK